MTDLDDALNDFINASDPKYVAGEILRSSLAIQAATKTIKNIMVFFFVVWLIGVVVLGAAFAITYLGERADDKFQDIENDLGSAEFRQCLNRGTSPETCELVYG